jgi:hypothetical protein
MRHVREILRLSLDAGLSTRVDPQRNQPSTKAIRELHGTASVGQLCELRGVLADNNPKAVAAPESIRL